MTNTGTSADTFNFLEWTPGLYWFSALWWSSPVEGTALSFFFLYFSFLSFSPNIKQLYTIKKQNCKILLPKGNIPWACVMCLYFRQTIVTTLSRLRCLWNQLELRWDKHVIKLPLVITLTFLLLYYASLLFEPHCLKTSIYLSWLLKADWFLVIKYW